MLLSDFGRFFTTIFYSVDNGLPEVAKYHFTCLAFYNKMKSVSSLITTKNIIFRAMVSHYG